MTDQPETSEAKPPQWTPLGPAERRVAGVLIEKAKTTPDQYPMSVNAIRNGCNQKSNRDPKMELDDERVEDALENLRQCGAVIEIQGDGRVPKYRHLMYEWLGVDKVELAIMAELLLRGAQTVGELRTRAARMEPISGISELWPLLAELRSRKLVVYLTPEGRGCIVTHGLHSPKELDKLKAKHLGGVVDADDLDDDPDDKADQTAPSPAAARVVSEPHFTSRSSPASEAGNSAGAANPAIQRELAQLRRELAELKESFHETIQDLQADLDDVRKQLGV